MLEHPQRVEAFKDEIAEMKLPDQAAGRDRTLLRVGVALMVVGIVLAPVAYATSSGTTNALQQRDAQILALSGVILAVVGAALFLRYSMAQFLRFWLARLSWEQQAQTDRVVEAMAPGSTSPDHAGDPADAEPVVPTSSAPSRTDPART